MSLTNGNVGTPCYQKAHIDTCPGHKYRLDKCTYCRSIVPRRVGHILTGYCRWFWQHVSCYRIGELSKQDNAHIMYTFFTDITLVHMREWCIWLRCSCEQSESLIWLALALNQTYESVHHTVYHVSSRLVVQISWCHLSAVDTLVFSRVCKYLF